MKYSMAELEENVNYKKKLRTLNLWIKSVLLFPCWKCCFLVTHSLKEGTYVNDPAYKKGVEIVK
jgi:hypothetical protein